MFSHSYFVQGYLAIRKQQRISTPAFLFFILFYSRYLSAVPSNILLGSNIINIYVWTNFETMKRKPICYSNDRVIFITCFSSYISNKFALKHIHSRAYTHTHIIWINMFMHLTII